MTASRTFSLLIAALALAACAENQANLGLGLGIGPNGVRVVPSVSAPVGENMSVGASPYGVGLGIGL